MIDQSKIQLIANGKPIEHVIGFWIAMEGNDVWVSLTTKGRDAYDSLFDDYWLEGMRNEDGKLIFELGDMIPNEDTYGGEGVDEETFSEIIMSTIDD